MAEGSELVARLANLFRGFAGAHGTHGEPVAKVKNGFTKWEIRSTARTLRAPVTQELWEMHVAGLSPLGVAAVMEDGTCVWGSIDVDDYDPDATKNLLRRVEQSGLPLVPGRSKSGGLHLFLFCEEPVLASQMQDTLRNVAASLGVGGAEIFPKQTAVIVDRGDLPGWMVMPYFGQNYQGRLRDQVGLRTSGAELTLEEFVRAGERARISPARVEELGAASVSPASSSAPRGRAARPGTTAEEGPFGDGPPCLQHLAAQKVELGGQNNALFMMATYYKKAYPDRWKEMTDQANREFLDPPGSSEGVASVIRSLERKDYEYQCRNEPMQSHCDVRRCRARRYGVGSWGEYPEISGLAVLMTEPVVWFVDVDGERVEIGTGDLQSYVRFHAVCMEKLSKCYKLMKQDTWLQIVNEAMGSVARIDPPPDLRPGAELHELLHEFLVNRRVGQRKEDMLSGRPWHNEPEGRYEFRLVDLEKFIKREGREKGRNSLGRMIEKIGGGRGFYNVGGRGINFCWLPDDMFEEEPEVAPPPVENQEVM